MLTVDTSAWIEWLVNSPTSKAFEKLLPSRDAWVVPTMVQLELVKWLKREANEAKANSVIGLTQMCVVVQLTSEIAVKAAELSVRHRLATADAIIYATALENDAQLLTCDSHFDGLPNVTYIKKKAITV